MEYKILESPGTEIDHIDGAAFNNFTAGDQSGILEGVWDECTPVLVDSETVMVSAGELIIKGFRIKITSPYTIKKESNLYDTVYYIIARLTVSSSKDVTFDIETRQTPDLVTEDMFTKGFGTYEIELCRFTVTSSGIKNLRKAAHVISRSLEPTPLHYNYIVTLSVTFENLFKQGPHKDQPYTNSFRVTDFSRTPRVGDMFSLIFIDGNKNNVYSFCEITDPPVQNTAGVWFSPFKVVYAIMLHNAVEINELRAIVKGLKTEDWTFVVEKYREDGTPYTETVTKKVFVK